MNYIYILGRLSRPRNVSCERITSHATEFTSASALLTPRSHDATQQVRQHEADEDFARRLQVIIFIKISQ